MCCASISTNFFLVCSSAKYSVVSCAWHDMMMVFGTRLQFSEYLLQRTLLCLLFTFSLWILVLHLKNGRNYYSDVKLAGQQTMMLTHLSFITTPTTILMLLLVQMGSFLQVSFSIFMSIETDSQITVYMTGRPVDTFLEILMTQY